MFDRNNFPWNNVGVDVSYATELKAVLKTGGLDFTVCKAPVCFNPNHHIKNGVINYDEVSGQYVTYRTDNGEAFGIVGSKYEIVQNEDAFKFIELLYDEINIHYEVAGLMNDGHKMFVVVQLPDTIIIGEDDHINKYLLFTTTHDGSGSITIAIIGVRIRCSNAIQAAIKNAGNKFILKHTKNVKERMEYVRQLIKAQEKYFVELEQMLHKLKEVKLTAAHIDQCIAYIFLPKAEYDQYMVERYNLYDNLVLSTKRINTLIEIRAALNYAPGQSDYINTGLWLYNGITSYLQNVREFKSADDRLCSVVDDKYGPKIDKVIEILLTR